MSNLELWLGLDFSKYQLGDKLILKEKDVLKHRMFDGKMFNTKLQQTAAKYGLWCTVSFNNEANEYEIEFVEYKPEDFTIPRPDAKTSAARRR